MTARHDFAVIGGGIIGASAAFFLAQAGARVIVLEKDHSGRHASGVNSGGVRTLGRDLRELPLSLRAMGMWPRMRELFGDDCGFTTTGNIRIATTESDFEHLVARSRSVAELGLGHSEEVLGRAALRDALPGISNRAVGALRAKDGGYAQPFRTTMAIRNAARALGVVFRDHCRVTAAVHSGQGWELQPDCGDIAGAAIVLNCSGGWGDQVAALFGDDIPLTPTGSVQLVTARMPRVFGPVISSASRPLSMKQFANGTIVIGGGQRAAVDRDSNRSDAPLLAMAPAVRAAIELFPALAGATAVRTWSGIEGFTADRLPVIGAGRAPSVLHAFGFSGHGFQMGPATGRLLADIAMAGRSDISIEAFNPFRFDQSQAVSRQTIKEATPS